MKDIADLIGGAMIRPVAFALGLSLAAGSAGAQSWSGDVTGGPVEMATPMTMGELQKKYQEAAWWQSCTLSRKCSEWVRGTPGASGPNLPVTESRPEQSRTSGYIMSNNSGTTFIYPATPCVQNGDTYTCTESQTPTIAPPPPDSSWHIQIRRGGLTHANCEDIKRGAEAEGATGECFQ